MHAVEQVMQETTSIYRAALEEFPANGWASHGLAATFDALGMADAAAESHAHAAAAWARADVLLVDSATIRLPATPRLPVGPCGSPDSRGAVLGCGWVSNYTWLLCAVAAAGACFVYQRRAVLIGAGAHPREGGRWRPGPGRGGGSPRHPQYRKSGGGGLVSRVRR